MDHFVGAVLTMLAVAALILGFRAYMRHVQKCEKEIIRKKLENTLGVPVVWRDEPITSPIRTMAKCPVHDEIDDEMAAQIVEYIIARTNKEWRSKQSGGGSAENAAK